MQTKKFIAKCLGYQDVVDAIENYPANDFYTIIDGDFLRNTWFRKCKDTKPHPKATMENGVWTLIIHKNYIMRELSSLEEQLL